MLTWTEIPASRADALLEERTGDDRTNAREHLLCTPDTPPPVGLALEREHHAHRLAAACRARNTPIPADMSLLPDAAAGTLSELHTAQQGAELTPAEARRRAMGLAISPLNAQSLIMYFMLWRFSSGTPHFFTVIILFTAVFSGLTTLFSTTKHFAPLRHSGQSLLLPMAVYVLLQVANLAITAFILHKIRLLPTHAQDWVFLIPHHPETALAGWDVSVPW